MFCMDANRERKRMKLSRVCAVMGLFILPAGCAVLPVAVVVGAGGGVAYTVTNIAYKTTNHAIEDVERAAHLALEKMEIKEVERSPAGDDVRIKAQTEKLKILIDLEKITPRATRIKVDARKGEVLKDKAAAVEIIEQIESILK